MENQPELDRLRPLERRILAMRREGVPVEEIADRLKKSPEFINRVIEWTKIPRSGSPKQRRFRPIERRVLDLRSQGEDHETIGERFKRSGRFIRQVEGLAHYREGIRLLSGTATSTDE